MAYVIPMRTGSERRLLIIVLTKENLDRMRQGDPFDLETHAYVAQFDLDRLVGNLDIIVAYEEDGAVIERLAAAGDVVGIVNHLERGRRHRPGDAVPPVSIKGN